MSGTANIDQYGLCRAGFLEQGSDKYSSVMPPEHELLKARNVSLQVLLIAISPAPREIVNDSRHSEMYYMISLMNIVWG